MTTVLSMVLMEVMIVAVSFIMVVVVACGAALVDAPHEFAGSTAIHFAAEIGTTPAE
jgi:hypothetical protein